MSLPVFLLIYFSEKNSEIGVVFVLKMKNAKMRSITYQAFVFLIILSFTACGKIEKLPPEPSITFKSFEVFDSIDPNFGLMREGRLNFYFEDGDGDLGLPNPEEYSLTDSTNLFFNLYRKTGGVFVPVSDSDPLKPSDYRIPYMDRQGQNKILRGNISITFLYLFYSASDTIKYQFYVKDRADHSSNSASTCEIVISNKSICKNQGN